MFGFDIAELVRSLAGDKTGRSNWRGGWGKCLWLAEVPGHRTRGPGVFSAGIQLEYLA